MAKIYAGTYFKIPLYIDVTWFAMVMTMYLVFGSLQGLVYCVGFLFVVMHEYGHCVMAKKLGFDVIDVTLYPIGGVAAMKIANVKPLHELLIAIAGPAVNLVLLILSFGACIAIFNYWDMGQYKPFSIVPFDSHPNVSAHYFFVGMALIAAINFMLLWFNMIPAFPMDGGRVLRAGLHYFTEDILYATTFAVAVSHVVCITLAIFFFIYFQWILAPIILLLMIFMAQSELSYVKQEVIICSLKRKIATILDRPELAEATTDQIVSEVAANPELKEEVAELLAVLRKHENPA